MYQVELDPEKVDEGWVGRGEAQLCPGRGANAKSPLLLVALFQELKSSLKFTPGTYFQWHIQLV